MKYFDTLIFLASLLIIGCSKPAVEYKEIAEKSLNEEKVELAINNLNLLIEKYPSDSLASYAQFKVALI